MFCLCMDHVGLCSHLACELLVEHTLNVLIGPHLPGVCQKVSLWHAASQYVSAYSYGWCSNTYSENMKNDCAVYIFYCSVLCVIYVAAFLRLSLPSEPYVRRIFHCRPLTEGSIEVRKEPNICPSGLFLGTYVTNKKQCGPHLAKLSSLPIATNYTAAFIFPYQFKNTTVIGCYGQQGPCFLFNSADKWGQLCACF